MNVDKREEILNGAQEYVDTLDSTERNIFDFFLSRASHKIESFFKAQAFEHTKERGSIASAYLYKDFIGFSKTALDYMAKNNPSDEGEAYLYELLSTVVDSTTASTMKACEMTC